MRRKWGSCTSLGTITLAVDLVEQRLEFQDFVIVHELLHLRYSTHGRVFKALLTAHVPDWKSFDVAVGEPLSREPLAEAIKARETIGTDTHRTHSSLMRY